MSSEWECLCLGPPVVSTSYFLELFAWGQWGITSSPALRGNEITAETWAKKPPYTHHHPCVTPCVLLFVKGFQYRKKRLYAMIQNYMATARFKQKCSVFEFNHWWALNIVLPALGNSQDLGFWKGYANGILQFVCCLNLRAGRMMIWQ